MEKAEFHDPESGETVDFYVLEETKLGGCNYLLVTDAAEGDGECYCLKESGESDGEVAYEMVEDDTLLDALAGIFADLLEDVEIV